MRRFHLLFGALVLLVFVLTGQYMDRLHNHLDGYADAPRMLYRSRHIYILLAGLINLSLGAYAARLGGRLALPLQLAGSGLLAAATCLLVAAFFYEPPFADLERVPYSRLGLYLILAGTLAHAAAGALARKEIHTTWK